MRREECGPWMVDATVVQPSDDILDTLQGFGAEAHMSGSGRRTLLSRLRFWRRPPAIG